MGFKALDLYCGAGGVSKGLRDAGFDDVYGVDINPQPRYPWPDRFIQADAISAPVDLSAFDFIWASPPCQAFTPATALERKRGKDYPDLVAPTRALLQGCEALTCMENVPQAPVRRDLYLDGTMFPPLKVIRRRAFELNFFMLQPSSRYRRGLVRREGWVTVCGGGRCSGTPRAANAWHTEANKRAAMGIDWMNRRELAEAVPPPFAEFIAVHALRLLRAAT